MKSKSRGERLDSRLLPQAMEALQAKDYRAAHQCCQEYLQAHGSDSVALHIRAIIYLEQGQLSTATQWVQQALRANPQSAEAHNTLGVIANRLGQEDRAFRAFQHSLRYQPDNPDVLKNLAMVYLSRGELTQAEAMIHQGLALKPSHGTLLNSLGLLHLKQKQFDEAQAAFEQAIAQNPTLVDAHCNLAWALEQRNNLEAARGRYEMVLKLKPDHCKAYYALSGLKKTQANDPAFAALERLKWTTGRSPRETSDLYFALGKMYADIGNDDAAFLHYKFGNDAWKKVVNHDPIAHRRKIERLIAATPASAFDNRAGADQSDRPVFIVGMPRSGTTLVEQILSSHPDIYGAGELEWIGKLSNHCFSNASSFEDAIPSISPQQRQAYGIEYLKQLEQLNSQAKRVIDKMPDNFQSLGFIAQVLPQAKVIHLRRNPLDTCVACYTTHFFAGHAYTSDLKHLGMYYADYQNLMDHWQAVLPLSILNVDYETLVRNQVSESQRLIEFLGLPWRDECLNFHQNPRVVSTASVLQVRQPLYTSSINRWKRYETHLADLMAELQFDTKD